MQLPTMATLDISTPGGGADILRGRGDSSTGRPGLGPYGRRSIDIEGIDDFRARILINYGVMLDQRVSGKVFSALFDASVRGDTSARAQALRDLDQFRQTLTGAAAAVFFDVPWIPVFVIVLYIISPAVGVVTTIGAFVLLGLALLQERTIRPVMREASDGQLRSYAFTDAALRNGE